MINRFLKIFIFSLIIMSYKNSNSASWKNWAGNQQCNPKQILVPETLEELQQTIKNANSENKHVRAVGSGHSWNNVVCTSDYLIDLKKLNKVLKIDKAKKQVKVQAGITLKRLYEELAKNGMALKNQAAIQEQTLAGAISTATHGSGKTGTLASFIVGIDLVTPDGKLLELTPEKNNDIFSAANTAVGTLGVIYALTVQATDLFRLKEIIYRTTWDKIKDKYLELLAKNDYFQFTIDPYTNRVFVTIINRTDKDGQAKENNKSQDQTESIFDQSKDIDKDTIVNQEEDYSYKILSGNPAPLYLEEEIAIEKKDFPNAIEAVFELIKRWKNKNIKISYILVRFAKPDMNNYLSHAAGRDTTFISIMADVSEKYYPFYKDYYKTLLLFKGRPHWGKLNYVNPDDALMLYGENFKKFKEIRNKLDPNRTFSSEFTRRSFGD